MRHHYESRGTDDYPLGLLDAERQRLRDQDEVLAPHSENFFRQAGIGPGMRVLDVGCGVGVTTGLLASIVGPTGSVIGVDRDPVSLEQAAAWMAERHIGNVEFKQAVLPDLELPGPVDAVAGRFVLAYLRDPAGALRELCRHLVPGGLVTFQEFVISQIRAIPEVPLWTQIRDWAVLGLRAGGGEPDSGDRLPSVFRGAGLSQPEMASATPLLGPESALPRVCAGVIAGVAPILVKQGIVAEGEIDGDRLARDVADQARAAQAMLYYVQLNAAWARAGNEPG